ncbi:MAG: hypothetical protein AXW14_15325 [Alteromonas sp. Nap_26]|nr:MAG: hypothetical protein AXW14_15325 [Alteromonas sp. Nap_26]
MQEAHIYVGINGAGKSFKLGKIAKKALRLNRPVVAVSMSLNDKFPPNFKKRPYNFMGIKQGRSVYRKAIEDALIACNREEHPVQINTLLKILSYAGYDERIGFLVRGFDWSFESRFESESFTNNLSKDAVDNIFSLCLAYRRIHNENDSENLHWVTHYSKFGSQSVLDIESRFGEVPSGEILSELLKHKALLKKLKIIKDIRLFFEKENLNRKLFAINEMSSGELSLISTAFFLSHTLKDGGMLLIDEPENSLHPEWQLAYISRIKDLFPYTDYQFHIATHSPLIISGAQKEENTLIHRFDGSRFKEIDSTSKNIEDALIDQFGIITPKNNALSERCIEIINSVIDKKISKKEAIEKVSQFKNSSYEETQKQFLQSVQELIRDEV